MSSPIDSAPLAVMFQNALNEFAAMARVEIGRVSRDIASFPIDMQARILELMRGGWAVDPDQPILFVRLVSGEFGTEGEGIDAWIADHFESRLDDIQTLLAKRHPERAALLADAFNAPRSELYTLSIPVFLAQAEGVVADRFKRIRPFSKVKNVSLASLLSDMGKGQLATLWADIQSGKADLSANVSDLPDEFNGLNRHAVMHGASVSYGTKVNSLKAISTLYMASFFVASEAHDQKGLAEISAEVS